MHESVESGILIADDAKWAQLLQDKINLSYPFDTTPQETLVDLGLPHSQKMRTGFGDANLFADFDTASMNSSELTEFLDVYLAKAFGTNEICDYDVAFDVAERGTIMADTIQEFLREIVNLKRRLEGRPARSHR